MKTVRALAVPLVVMAMVLSLSMTNVNAAPGPIVVTKTASSSTVAPGSTITYTITARNEGSDPATGLVLTDTLNANLDFVAGSLTPATIVPQANGTTLVTFNLGTLGASASQTVSITTRADTGVSAGTIVGNTATVTGTNVALATSNNVSVTVTPPGPVIIISKVPNSGAVTAGGTITYDATIRNVGGAAATNVVISDFLDPATSLISVMPTPTASSSGTISFNAGVLDPNEAFTFRAVTRVRATAPIGTVIDNTIRVTSDNAVTVQAPSAVLVVSAAPGTPTPTPTATPVPTADPDALPRTGVGEVLVILLIGLLVISVWPLLGTISARHE